jgi:hypothetical protein
VPSCPFNFDPSAPSWSPTHTSFKPLLTLTHPTLTFQTHPTQELYAKARQLAACVVPHEYGLEAEQKLRIGSKIAAELLTKLLMDLASMQVRWKSQDKVLGGCRWARRGC